MGLDIYPFKPSAPHDQMLEFFTLEELAAFPAYIDQNRMFVVPLRFEDSDDPLPAIYFTTAGYQRKRMTAGFYQAFDNDGIYADAGACVRALAYVEGDNDRETSELRAAFQENFIDSFEEGKSLFFISR